MSTRETVVEPGAAQTVSPTMPMTLLNRTKTWGRRGVRRAATMIEFALILPIFLFLMLFTVDLGTIMLISGAMNDNAYSAARAGAQAGGGSVVVPGGTGPVSPDAVAQAAAQVPMSTALWSFDAAEVEVLTGDVCSTRGEDVNVTVKVPYGVNLVTPGLGALLNVFGAGDSGLNDTGFQLTATGVARCEVYRNP